MDYLHNFERTSPDFIYEALLLTDLVHIPRIDLNLQGFSQPLFP
jgi:hypothetical protein